MRVLSCQPMALLDFTLCVAFNFTGVCLHRELSVYEQQVDMELDWFLTLLQGSNLFMDYETG